MALSYLPTKRKEILLIMFKKEKWKKLNYHRNEGEIKSSIHTSNRNSRHVEITIKKQNTSIKKCQDGREIKIWCMSFMSRIKYII